MGKLPRVRGRQVVAALRRAGFELLRARGSHRILAHPDGRRTVVPVHAREIIGPGLMGKILKDCDMTAEEFAALL